jgi:prepilin-type N-terminal cleavage/methylation domain-containing protein
LEELLTGMKSGAAQQQRRRRGITLVEMLVVIAIIGVIVSISFPAVSSGLDSIRLSSACSGTAAFLNSAVNHAERRQQLVELTVLRRENRAFLRSTDPAFVRELELGEGVEIAGVAPPLPNGMLDEDVPRRFLFYPGATVPRMGIVLANRRGDRRLVRIDPITGAPMIEEMPKP